MTKRSTRIIVCVVLCTFSFCLNAQTKKYLKDFDYGLETTINGSRGSETMYLAVEDNINFLNSYINLELKTSQVIDGDKSYVTILMGDHPVETRFLRNNNQLMQFKIPLRKKHVQSGFIKLSIQTNLRINDEICELLSYGGFWVTLTENSYVSYELIPKRNKFSKKTINQLLPDIKQIVIAETPSIEEIKYAAYIKFYFKRVYGLDLTINTFKTQINDSINESIIIMPYEKLSARQATNLPKITTEDTGLVAVSNTSFKDKTTKELNYVSNVIVTGNSVNGVRKAAYFMLQKHLLNAAYVDYVLVNETSALLSTPNRKEYEPIHFNELGAVNSVLRGIGFISSNIVMPRANFGSNVKKMEVNMIGKYRPLAETEQGYMNLYFNDNLLKSYKLDDTGELAIKFDFDDIIMQQENIFKYEYYFIPQGGLCKIAAANFYGQIAVVNSYFKPVAYKSSTSLSFFRFPENFQTKPLVVYTDLKAEPKLIPAIAELVDILNPGEVGLSGFVYPEIKTAEEKSIEEDSENSKIIITSKNDEFTNFFGSDPYIRFDKEEVTYESEELNTFFKVKYSENMGFNQLFYHKRSPVMLINIPSDYQEETLTSLITNIRDQNIANTGNVIIANKEKSYFFDLRIPKITMDKNQVESMFDGFWKKYRLFITLILIILVGLLLSYIYQKSKESKQKIKNA